MSIMSPINIVNKYYDIFACEHKENNSAAIYIIVPFCLTFNQLVFVQSRNIEFFATIYSYFFFSKTNEFYKNDNQIKSIAESKF